MMPKKEELSTKSNSGFTTFEILLVVSILGLLASIILIRNASQVSYFKLVTSIEQTHSFFELAREYAFSKNEPIKVTFSTPEDKITKFFITTTDALTSSTEIDSLDIENDMFVTENSKISGVIFSPNGSVRTENKNKNSVITKNIVLRFFNQSNVTSDMIIYHQTGSIETIKP